MSLTLRENQIAHVVVSYAISHLIDLQISSELIPSPTEKELEALLVKLRGLDGPISNNIFGDATTQKFVRDLVPGDRVDLYRAEIRHKFNYTDRAAEFEYGVVNEVVRGVTCCTIIFKNMAGIALPLDFIVEVALKTDVLRSERGT